jgi:hypothetical protein
MPRKTATLKSKSPLAIATQSTDHLELHYFAIKDLEQYFLEGNSKQHDCPKVWESIMKYGFSDPLKLDPALNGGKGGVVEGNGRLQATLWSKEKGFEPAWGIKVTEDGQWCLPCLVGVNQYSEAAAIAYSIEHNVSNTWGTGLTPIDAGKLFDWDSLSVQLEELSTAEFELLSWDDAVLEELSASALKDDEDEIQGREGSQSKINECPNCGHKWE